jgi:hypothetical protein
MALQNTASHGKARKITARHGKARKITETEGKEGQHGKQGTATDSK